MSVHFQQRQLRRSVDVLTVPCSWDKHKHTDQVRKFFHDVA